MRGALRRRPGLLGWAALLVLVLAAAACGGGSGDPATVTDLSQPSAAPGASATPTGSASASASPTPAATPTSTATATAAPTAAPTPTADMTPVATPTASATPTAEQMAQAAKDAWALVFNSRAEFADKAPHLEDAASLESSNAAYAETGETFGGVSLEATEVEIDGDFATVTYSFLFAGVPAYEDLAGEMHLVDGVWTVSRETFCGIMASARTPCS